MKNLFTSYRRLLMTSVLCLGAVLIVQSKEVEVTASAHLSDLLSEEDLQSLTELIVTTNGADLTVADFDIINEMSSVKIVDLSSATTENQLMPANLQKNKIIEIFKLPGNTKNIAGGAFTECAMKQIYIPATVNGTGNMRSRFDKCKSLTEVIERWQWFVFRMGLFIVRMVQSWPFIHREKQMRILKYLKAL